MAVVGLLPLQAFGWSLLDTGQQEWQGWNILKDYRTPPCHTSHILKDYTSVTHTERVQDATLSHIQTLTLLLPSTRAVQKTVNWG
jgi:hypothetical protein